MKKTLLIVAGILAPLALQAEPTEGAKKERPARAPRELPAEVIAKFDKDGDGKLDEEERKAAREARRAEMEKRRAEMLEKFDTDNDGKLSPEERKAALIARFDKDGDGVLSEEEKEAIKKEMPRGGEGRRPGGKGGEGKGEGPRGKRGPKPAGE
ncbi:EF-hand domain-containing protein [Roseibacillus persicicus]|uniref:EF-hand domain-containing protein n=1 Tax=Roseibacillus persicicus TaxID=454148 RepID=UPI00280F77CF|nr:EF-hand domain-containing protein [Roseibacillus persicicus]MDQ8192229.1 hypothetical protein [Roseibacillus persicicus]